MGWPKTHSRRCGYYYRLITTYNKFVNVAMENEVRSLSALPATWSKHETEIFKRIANDLADLYNNRFIEYYKMKAERDEYDPPNIENTTKFKLKKL
jgi:hypothetical protein